MMGPKFLKVAIINKVGPRPQNIGAVSRCRYTLVDTDGVQRTVNCVVDENTISIT